MFPDQGLPVARVNPSGSDRSSLVRSKDRAGEHRGVESERCVTDHRCLTVAPLQSLFFLLGGVSARRFSRSRCDQHRGQLPRSHTQFANEGRCPFSTTPLTYLHTRNVCCSSRLTSETAARLTRQGTLTCSISQASCVTTWGWRPYSLL